jgi:hypothetical protein
MYLTAICYEINLLFYYHNVTHDQQSVTNFLVSASTNVITSAMQYLTLFSLDEGGSRFLQNICSSVSDYTAATPVPLYQTTPLSRLPLHTRLHSRHICPSVPDYTTATSVPLYQTTSLPHVPLYQTTPLPHLPLCTRLPYHHTCPTVPNYTTIMYQNM